MSGIVGVIGKKAKKYYSNVESALKIIEHRGANKVSVICADCYVIGGCTQSNDKNLVLFNREENVHEENVACYDGEIYDISNGIQKNNNQDMIRLIEDIENIPLEIFNKYDADFALVSFNTNKKCLYIARDLFGVKPLYYTWIDSDTLAFASEIKALCLMEKKRIMQTTILDYLIFGYPIRHSTFFDNIFMFPRGSIYKWDLKSNEKQFLVNKNYFSDDMDKSFEKTLENAVLSRIPQNTAFGCHLSGGADSSMLAYIASKSIDSQVNCITAYNSEGDQDIIFSKRCAEKYKMKLYDFKLEPYDYKELIQVLDSPIMSTGAFVPFQCAKKAKKLNLNVLLGGQGADELLQGYECFVEVNSKNRQCNCFELHNNSDFSLICYLFGFKMSVSQNIQKMYENFIDNKNESYFQISREQNFYINYFLQELLRIEDHVHMKNSIVSRYPFLSRDFGKLLYSGRLKPFKQELLDLHKKYNTPIVERKKKGNMNIPMQGEIVNRLKEFQILLDNNKCFKNLNIERLKGILDPVKLMMMNRKQIEVIWNIYNIYLWMDILGEHTALIELGE